MARVLVTGASGFIGAHVARRLGDAGHVVVAHGRVHARIPVHARLQPHLADLCSDGLDALVDRCDAVVHCAAMSRPWGRPEEFDAVNVTGTTRLLDASRRARVQRFVHLGSPSIYFRFADQLQLREDFAPPRRWITDYARSKWASEIAVRKAAADGLSSVVLRPRAVFGAGDVAILPRLLAVAASSRFPLPSGGRALIDITHVDNVVDAVECALRADVPGDGRAYNISNGEPVRVRALLQRLFSLLDLDVRLLSIPRTVLHALAAVAEQAARVRPGRPEPHLTRYGVGVLAYSQTLDITRAQRELGYAPRVSIDDGLERFAHSWRSDGPA